MAKYGIPYMGSKASIVEKMLEVIPEADHFYDLFGGGFSVSHCALTKFPNKWKHVHYNEVDKGTTDLVSKAINGEFSYKNFKPQWVDRETFAQEKNKDAYIGICWSFGNNQRNYLFGKSIEDKKRSGHMAVVFEEMNTFVAEVLGFTSWESVGLDGDGKIKERRLYWRRKCAFKRLERLQQLQQLQQLERLEQLERLQRLQITALSFEQINVPPGSVIYCDIPYAGTSKYKNTDQFDRKWFLDWASSHPLPVFISEYSIEHSGLALIWSISKKQKLCATKTRKVFEERLYANASALKILSQGMAA